MSKRIFIKDQSDFKKPFPIGKDISLHVIDGEDEYYVYVKRSEIGNTVQRLKDLKELGYKEIGEDFYNEIKEIIK